MNRQVDSRHGCAEARCDSCAPLGGDALVVAVVAASGRGGCSRPWLSRHRRARESAAAAVARVGLQIGYGKLLLPDIVVALPRRGLGVAPDRKNQQLQLQEDDADERGEAEGGPDAPKDAVLQKSHCQ